MKTTSKMVLTLLLAMLGGQACADTYPSKPIHLVLAVPPGGASDVIARPVGPELAKALGVPVIIEYRSGASGSIAANYVAKSTPDGYTLLQNSSTTAMAPYVLAKLPYDPQKDFASVSLLATMPVIMVVNAELPVNSVKDYIALAKSKPGQLGFATSGTGSGTHMAAEQFMLTTGTKLQHIPYKGSGPAAMDVASGVVQTMFDAPASLLPFIKSGKMRPLAAAGTTRNNLLPDVPTFDELGYKGMDSVLIWYGIQVPAATPPAIVHTLNSALGKVLRSQQIRTQLASQGMQAAPDTSEEYDKFQHDASTQWGEVIKKNHIQFN